MLILSITEGAKKERKHGSFFHRKAVRGSPCDFRRSSVNINGKNVIILNISEDGLKCEEVRTLLKIYRGRVLLSKGKNQVELPRNLLFDPKRYYMRAVLSSLVNQMKTVNKEWKKVCIKIETFEPVKEFYQIVKSAKALCLLTPKSPLTDSFVNNCYNEYGAVVKVADDCFLDFYDVFLNLEEVDEKGRLIIKVKGKPLLLYPDMTYFESNTEYQKLADFDIEHDVVCAAFSGK